MTAIVKEKWIARQFEKWPRFFKGRTAAVHLLIQILLRMKRFHCTFISRSRIKRSFFAPLFINERNVLLVFPVSQQSAERAVSVSRCVWSFSRCASSVNFRLWGRGDHHKQRGVLPSWVYYGENLSNVPLVLRLSFNASPPTRPPLTPMSTYWGFVIM